MESLTLVFEKLVLPSQLHSKHVAVVDVNERAQQKSFLHDKNMQKKYVLANISSFGQKRSKVFTNKSEVYAPTRALWFLCNCVIFYSFFEVRD